MSTSSSNVVTELLQQWRRGDPGAEERLFSVVYDELRRLARFHMRGERADHTLQPTVLVHEAYARLVVLELTLQDRAHFFRMAARTMRRVLVDHARARHAEKRGGNVTKILLEETEAAAATRECDVIDLDRCLNRLSELDKRQSQVIELHYFAGLNYEEIGLAMQLSRTTVSRDLQLAKLWLRRELSGDHHGC